MKYCILRRTYMPLLIENIEEYDNDSVFEDMVEIVFPTLDEMLFEEMCQIQDDHGLSDSMVKQLLTSWLMKKGEKL